MRRSILLAAATVGLALLAPSATAGSVYCFGLESSDGQSQVDLHKGVYVEVDLRSRDLPAVYVGVLSDSCPG
jgi:hypothetical protein